MAFISLTEIATINNGRLRNRGKRVTGKRLSIGVASSGKSKTGQQRPTLTLRISKDLAQEARILPGDRLDVLIDRNERLGLIRRIKDGGYSASASGIKSDNIKAGEFYPIVTKITYYEGMPKVDETTDCENITVSNEGIIFALPDNATF
jgi:hypothetical protein